MVGFVSWVGRSVRAVATNGRLLVHNNKKSVLLLLLVDFLEGLQVKTFGDVMMMMMVDMLGGFL